MHIRSLALAAISLSAFSTAAAQAQIAEAEADAGDAIIVTAQLREQDAIDVPMALSVAGAEQLDRFGLYEFDALSRFVPGFEVQNQSPNNPGFVMRGITSDSGTAPTSRASPSSRTASPSPSRAAPMSSCSTSSGSRSPRGRNRRSTGAAR